VLLKEGVKALMGIQAKNNNTAFLLDKLNCCRRFLSMGLLGLQLPFCIKGAVAGFLLNSPKSERLT